MFKSVKNILIIFLIGLIAFGINIGSSPVNNSADQVTKYSNMNKIFLSTNIIKDLHYNPNAILVSHQSTNETTLEFIDSYIFVANIYKDNDLYKTLNLGELKEDSSITINSNDSFTNEIDISQDALELPNGKYEIVINTTANNNDGYISPINLNIEYNKTIPYISASNDTPKGKIGLTLYFPDSNYSLNELIGITRFVDYTKAPMNTVIDQLKNYPSNNSGLSIYPPVGNVNYIDIYTDKKNKLTYVDLPPNDDIYTSDKTKSLAAMNSFMKSITKTSTNDIVKSITKINRIERIKFLVDYQKATTFFIDQDVSKSIKYLWNDKAYLSYSTGERYYLVDYDIENIKDLNLDDKINTIYKTLKNGANNLNSTIAENVNLIDYSLKNNTLNLNFNSTFSESFNNEINLQSLMLDSILFSFTSIEGIDYINILVDGNNINNFAGINVSNPMKAPMYINPEM